MQALDPAYLSGAVIHDCAPDFKGRRVLRLVQRGSLQDLAAGHGVRERVAEGDGRVNGVGGCAGSGGEMGLGSWTRFWGGFGEPLYDDDADGFLLCEMAVYVDDAYGEEPGFVAERRPRAVVDVYCAMGREAVQDPEVAVSNGVGDGEEGRVKGDWFLWLGGWSSFKMRVL